MGEKQRGNTKNLKPQWPKGVSGNPNGRPKLGLSMADLIRSRLEDGDKGAKIVDAMVSRSLEGSDQATKILLDRAYGMAPQTVDVTTNVHTETVEKVMAMTRDFLLKKAPNLAAEYLEYMAK